MPKRKKNDAFFFSVIKDRVTAEGMWEVTPETIEKIWTVQALTPPDAERMIDVKERVSFVWETHGHALWLHTKFNRKTKKNSPFGCISIVISKLVDSGEERVMYRTFYTRATGTWVDKVSGYIYFLIDQMKDHWPLTWNENWASIKEFKHDTYYWVDEKGKKIRKIFDKGTTNYFSHVRRGERKRLRYHTVEREQLGIERFRRDIRKPYIRKT